jgi:hypothetical protein
MDDNSFTKQPSGATGAGIATQSDRQTPDLFGENAGQSQSATEQSQNLGGMSQSQGGNGLGGSTAGLDAEILQGGNAFASTAGLTGDLKVRTPDSGVAQAGDPTFAGEVHDNAADAFAPDTQETEGTNSDPSEPNAVDAVTYEGKRVFSAHELNQAGEDKEYFHPDKNHKFDAPKDANHHALTPDIEVKADNTIGRVG